MGFTILPAFPFSYFLFVTFQLRLTNQETESTICHFLSTVLCLYQRLYTVYTWIFWHTDSLIHTHIVQFVSHKMHFLKRKCSQYGTYHTPRMTSRLLQPMHRQVYLGHWRHHVICCAEPVRQQLSKAYGTITHRWQKKFIFFDFSVNMLAYSAD